MREVRHAKFPKRFSEVKRLRETLMEFAFPRRGLAGGARMVAPGDLGETSEPKTLVHP